MYVATRGLYNMSPPTVFVPPSIKEDVENLIELHRKMGDVELNLDLVALDVGLVSLNFSLYNITRHYQLMFFKANILFFILFFFQEKHMS